MVNFLYSGHETKFDPPSTITDTKTPSRQKDPILGGQVIQLLYPRHLPWHGFVPALEFGTFAAVQCGVDG